MRAAGIAGDQRGRGWIGFLIALIVVGFALVSLKQYYDVKHKYDEITDYTLNQLRYDLRKMKAHGLLERIGRSYRYRLSATGTKAALLFILFHKRVCGLLANSLFHHRPDQALQPPASKVETAYHKAHHAIQHVLDMLAA